MMTRIGGSCAAVIQLAGAASAVFITRICTGEVWVRSTRVTPSGCGAMKKVSCISRAGWPSGKLSAVKLCQSVSISGPSAMEKPMSEKMAVISSQTWLTGWMRPAAVGGAGSGRVTSRRSAARRAASASAPSSPERASTAVAISVLRPLMAGPAVLRSSGGMLPSEASSAETDPFLPRAATRTASSAAASPAAAMAASRSARRVSISWARSGMAAGPQRTGNEKAPRLPGTGGARLSLRPQKRLGRLGRNPLVRGLFELAEIAEGRFGLGDERGEGRRLGDREIGQHLAVDCHLSLAEAVDKSSVGQAVVADGGVDALDPQGAEVALLVAAVAIGVLAGLLDGLLGDADGR